MAGAVFALMAMSQATALQVHETELSNGMKVWLNVDHSQPKVFGAVVVGAGSVDCPDTGIAHYFEHIMFKGTLSWAPWIMTLRRFISTPSR